MADHILVEGTLAVHTLPVEGSLGWQDILVLHTLAGHIAVHHTACHQVSQNKRPFC